MRRVMFKRDKQASSSDVLSDREERFRPGHLRHFTVPKLENLRVWLGGIGRSTKSPILRRKYTELRFGAENGFEGNESSYTDSATMNVRLRVPPSRGTKLGLQIDELKPTFVPTGRPRLRMLVASQHSSSPTVGSRRTTALYCLGWSKSQDAVYSSFMAAHKCYDLIPTSSKLVVFDVTLPVRKAFFALIYNGVRAAPLYDSSKMEFVGMLTITDFIRILHKYNSTIDVKCDSINGLEDQKISAWRKELDRHGHLKPMVYITPSDSLYRAVQILCKEKVHRLPVVEEGTGNIAFILTHKRLIKFLYLYMVDLPRPSFMEKTPKELGIGSWDKVTTITKKTSLIDVLDIFLKERVSALPMVDEEGKLIDIYAKFDAINLAADKSYSNLNVTAHDALKHRSEWFEGVRYCSEKDNLVTVVEMIVRAEVHRLIVVNDEKKVVGVISLSDLLHRLVLDPPVLQQTAGNTEAAAEDSVSTDSDGLSC